MNTSVVYKILPIILLSVITLRCTTIPREYSYSTLEDYSLSTVRDAARLALRDVTPTRSKVRVYHNRLVVDGRIGECGKHVACGASEASPFDRLGTPWTTITIQLRPVDKGIATEVFIEYLTYCGFSCHPAPLGSTGVLEQELIEQIQSRLAGSAPTHKPPPPPRQTSSTGILTPSRWAGTP